MELRRSVFVVTALAAGVACGGELLSDAPGKTAGGTINPIDGDGAAPAEDGATGTDGGVADGAAAADAGDSGPTYSALCPKRPNPSAPAPFAAAPPDVNGSRIHARYVNGADGSRAFLTLHDDAYDLDCFVNWNDWGPQDCRFSSTPGVVPALFASADCSGALWSVRHGEPAPPRAGPRVTSPHRMVNGACELAPADYQMDYYAAGPAVPTDPVVFTPAAPTGVPGEAIVHSGSDGSSFWLGSVAAYGGVAAPRGAGSYTSVPSTGGPIARRHLSRRAAFSRRRMADRGSPVRSPARRSIRPAPRRARDAKSTRSSRRRRMPSSTPAVTTNS